MIKKQLTYTAGRNESLDLHDLQRFINDAQGIGFQIRWTVPTVTLSDSRRATGQVKKISVKKHA